VTWNEEACNGEFQSTQERKSEKRVERALVPSGGKVLRTHGLVRGRQLKPKRTSLESFDEQNRLGLLAEISEEDVLQRRETAVMYLRLLWRNRKLLFRTLAWSFVLGVAVAFLIPQRYEAVERLMPPDSQSGTGQAILAALAGGRTGSAGSIGALAGDLLGTKTTGALFVGILEGRTVQDQLIEQFGLMHLYHTKKIEDTREVLTKNTKVAEDRKSGIISVEVTDHDPRRAAAMAQAYVRELDRLVALVSTSSARRERIFLEGRLGAVKQELDHAAHDFSEFASKNTAIDIPAQGKAMVEAAATLQGELIAAESQLKGLEAIYTDQNVRVRALHARIAELRGQLGKLGGTPDDSGTSDAKNDPSYYPAIRQIPLLGVTYANLYRQTKIEETVYELLTQQYELAKVQEAKETPSVKVLDVAVVPTKKSFPPRALITLALMLISLTMACAWLLAKESWKGTDPQDPRKRFVLEVVDTLQADVLRLAPEGSFRRRVLARIGLLPAAQMPSDVESKQSEEGTEVARAAGSSL
jgi:uncharacterized protein involved in exopolysaccharide biosynthesis